METINEQIKWLKKMKTWLLIDYIGYWITLFMYTPPGLCHYKTLVWVEKRVNLDIINLDNAIKYGNGRCYLYWWKHPKESAFPFEMFDYKNRKKFLDWCISELEKKLAV